MTKSQHENYFYHKCKNDNLEKLSPNFQSFLKRPTPIPYFHPQLLDPRRQIKFTFSLKKRVSELWIYIMGSTPSLPPSGKLF